MKTKQVDIRPNVKQFTKKELVNLAKPAFQRWLNESNVTDLAESISESGILRLPIVCHIKSEKKDFLLDGRHLTEVIKNSSLYKDTDIFSCIYCEASDLAEAGEMFKNLNTRGRKLDWVDITQLYMHLNSEKNNIYEIIWHTFLREPENLSDVRNVLVDGFKLPTIIEFLCPDKPNYRIGLAKKGKDFVQRKNLLQYLISKTPLDWKEKFEDKGFTQPNGGSILGFANYWFNNKLHLEYDESYFLEIINEIFLSKQFDLKSRKLIINRDNAGALMKEYLEQVPA